MSEVSGAITRWLEQKRRTGRAWAAVISILALGSGAGVFLLATLLVYAALSVLSGSFGYSVPWIWLVACGLTAGFFARLMKGRHKLDLDTDPMGFWIIKDICSV